MSKFKSIVVESSPEEQRYEALFWDSVTGKMSTGPEGTVRGYKVLSREAARKAYNIKPKDSYFQASQAITSQLFQQGNSTIVAKGSKFFRLGANGIPRFPDGKSPNGRPASKERGHKRL